MKRLRETLENTFMIGGIIINKKFKLAIIISVIALTFNAIQLYRYNELCYWRKSVEENSNRNFLTSLDFISESLKSAPDSKIEKNVILRNISFQIGKADSLYSLTSYNNENLPSILQGLNSILINDNSEIFLEKGYSKQISYYLDGMIKDPTNTKDSIEFLQYLNELEIKRNTR